MVSPGRGRGGKSTPGLIPPGHRTEPGPQGAQDPPRLPDREVGARTGTRRAAQSPTSTKRREGQAAGPALGRAHGRTRASTPAAPALALARPRGSTWRRGARQFDHEDALGRSHSGDKRGERGKQPAVGASPSSEDTGSNPLRKHLLPWVLVTSSALGSISRHVIGAPRFVRVPVIGLGSQSAGRRRPRARGQHRAPSTVGAGLGRLAEAVCRVPTPQGPSDLRAQTQWDPVHLHE